MRMIYSMKRKVALVVACIMCSLTASAAEATIIAQGECGAEGSSVQWKYDDTGTLTISGTGAIESYSYVTQCPWNSYRNDIMSLIIEEGVTEIGSANFKQLKNITAVTLPSTMKKIGPNAFAECALSFTVDEANAIYSAVDGVLFNKDKTTLLQCKLSDTEYVEIPNSVTTIGNYAFSDCTSLTSIEIPSSVTTIGNEAFYGCTGLTSIEIPHSVTMIEIYAFSGCTKLSTVTTSCTPRFGSYDWNSDIGPDVLLERKHTYENGICTICDEPCDHKDSTHTTATNNGNVITESCSKCKVPLGTATITATNATYDGTAQETATVAYGTGWTGDRNLTVTYENNVNAGPATASITIGGVTARTTFTIQPKEITGAAVAIEQGASFVYSGEPFTPAVSVTLDGKPLAASDYQVSYAGNVNAGQAMVTVTGRGNYSGSATATFTIAKAPAPTLPATTVSRNYTVAKVSVPTGIVAGEGSSVSVGTASGSGSDKVADVILDAKGNLTFTLSGGANGDEIVLPVHLHSPNYEGPITATVTVTLTDKLDQRPLTVKATSTTVLSGGSLELSIGGGSGKGAVTYEVINGTGSASLSGSTLTGGAPGTVTVIATKAGTSQYNPARSQPLVITIE